LCLSASVLAWGEFAELKTKLEAEVFLKQQAEMFAHKVSNLVE